MHLIGGNATDGPELLDLKARTVSTQPGLPVGRALEGEWGVQGSAFRFTERH